MVVARCAAGPACASFSRELQLIGVEISAGGRSAVGVNAGDGVGAKRVGHRGALIEQ